jgi:hypothetical protein
MNTLSGQSNDSKSRENAWAQPVSRLTVSNVPAGAVNLNVHGRHIVGPLQGFGQMWQKIYQVRLSGSQVAPTEVIRTWKENFPKFWPQGNNFYAPLTSITPGEVAVLNLTLPGGMPLSTGVRVIYADDESFTFMTPEGHMFAAMITFSAYEEEGITVAQVQPLLRANDPLYEIGMRLGFAHKMEDEFWRATLRSLAAHFGVNGQVQQRTTLVDPRVQWREAKNIWQNAAVRSGIYTVGAPLRWARNLFTR